MSNTPEIQEQSIERREGQIGGRQLIISGRQAMIELDTEELSAVVGGKPVVEITIKPDGTIVIVQK
jgi:bacteriocin-like protein